MGFFKKGEKKIRIEDTIITAKDKLGYDDDKPSELKEALKGLNNFEELMEFVKGSDWKQRCEFLFELIYQYFDGRGTPEEPKSHDSINYVAVEVAEDFKEVFEAMQAKHPSVDLNDCLHGYLIHVRNLVKEETNFEYPNEILYLAGTMIAGKFKGFM